MVPPTFVVTTFFDFRIYINIIWTENALAQMLVHELFNVIIILIIVTLPN